MHTGQAAALQGTRGALSQHPTRLTVTRRRQRSFLLFTRPPACLPAPGLPGWGRLPGKHCGGCVPLDAVWRAQSGLPRLVWERGRGCPLAGRKGRDRLRFRRRNPLGSSWYKGQVERGKGGLMKPKWLRWEATQTKRRATELRGHTLQA